MNMSSSEKKNKNAAALSESGTPLYRQLADIIYQKIRNGEWKNGEKIPTEPELMTEYSVAKTTVRAAVDILVEDNILVRRQGKGTYVCEPQDLVAASDAVGFSKTCEKVGKKIESTVLEAGMVSPSVKEAYFFGIPDSAMIVRIRRLRFADGLPVVIETQYYPPECRELINADLTGSMTEVCSRLFGDETGNNERTIEACLANPEEARLLNIDPGSPVLLIRDKAVRKDGKAYFMSKQILDTSKLKLYV